METKILIPVDGSNTAGRTLEKIITLKQRFPKQLTLLHVVDVDKLAYRMIPDFQIDMVRENAGKAGQLVILLREETKPEDIHGFFASQGILTARGGKTSHAAVVARGMGKPCVAGAEGIEVDTALRLAQVGDYVIHEGDVITLQEIFRFRKTGMDEDGMTLGHFEATGIRPRFVEVAQSFGIDLSPELFRPDTRFE